MHIEITSEYLPSQGFSNTTPERFWSKVTKTDSCWIWNGSKRPTGHGQMSQPKRPFGAHVISWVLHRGPVPKGLSVLHNCPIKDNPACVNPDHLWLGTQSENNKDMDKKGVRGHGHLHGEANPIHKLTWEAVKFIREEYPKGDFSIRDLASRFGVTFTAVQSCIHMKTWKPHQ